jgi:hypothetical protein
MVTNEEKLSYMGCGAIGALHMVLQHSVAHLFAAMGATLAHDGLFDLQPFYHTATALHASMAQFPATPLWADARQQFLRAIADWQDFLDTVPTIGHTADAKARFQAAAADLEETLRITRIAIDRVAERLGFGGDPGDEPDDLDTDAL